MLGKAIVLEGANPRLHRAMDELELCQRIAKGEQHLFGQLIDQYQNLVAGAVAAQGVDRADIEDLAQQTFVNAYKGLGGFRGDAKLSSWLYRIAINVARQHLKRLAIKPRPASVEDEMAIGRVPSAGRAQEPVAQTEAQRALSVAMASLSDVQRTCLGLYYFEELSYEEIAEALAINLNTVRTHIRRGKLALAELLDQSTLDL